MGQPENPYQNQGFGGQQPWGQPPTGPDPWTAPGAATQPANPGWPGQPAPGWGQPPAPQTTSWSPQPDPWHNPAPAAPGGWQGPPPPPPPTKSNSGLIIGLISGAAVLLLVAGVVGLFLYRGNDRQNPVANPSNAASGTPSASASGSPTPAGTDPESLDSAESDETTLSTTAIFPDTSFTGDSGEEYALAGTLETSACTGVGGGKVKSVMKKHDCDRMVVGVYLTSDEEMFSALLVVPFATDEAADEVRSDIVEDKQDIINALTYYCPSDGKPGAKLCKRSSDDLPTWYASFTTFHRYLFIAISLYTDGHRTKDMSEVDDVTTDIGGYVSGVLLGKQ